jgi:hypothetical protein
MSEPFAKQSDMESFIEGALDDGRTAADIPVFTFVRDPMTRFMSGFSEAVFREFWFKRKQHSLQLNVSDAKSYLTTFLNYEHPIAGLEHVQPMAGAFFHFRIDILGRLESFREDWASKVQAAYNLSSTTLNEEVGQHATSQNHPRSRESKSLEELDPHNARRALAQLFEQEVAFLRAVCHLILVDYVCLPMYALPLECQHLNRTRDAALTALFNNQVII